MGNVIGYKVDKTMEACMANLEVENLIGPEVAAAISAWLLKGFEIEIYRKPDGTLNIKTVKKKRLIVE